MKSIIQTNDECCYLCGKALFGYKHKHHIFNGIANRKKCDEDLIFCYVHPACHDFIHSHQKTDLNLKARCQKIWQDHYKKTEEYFIERYGKSYVD